MVLLTALLLALVVATPTGATADERALAAQSVGTARLACQGRYDTMAAIVSEGFPSGSAWAILATGDSFPDALAASGLAGAHRCPIVLTSGKSLSPQARSELERLRVTDV